MTTSPPLENQNKLQRIVLLLFDSVFYQGMIMTSVHRDAPKCIRNDDPKDEEDPSPSTSPQSISAPNISHKKEMCNASIRQLHH